VIGIVSYIRKDPTRKYLEIIIGRWSIKQDLKGRLVGKNHGWKTVDNIYGRRKRFNPIVGRNMPMKQHRQTRIHNVTMFPFNPSVLLLCVWARQAMKRAIIIKQPPNIIVDKFRATITLKRFDFARKLCLHKC
jgi:hypothetical protein